MRTRFILVQPSHAGNVGAAARAMKVMGFDELVLVAPRWPDVLARPEAVERASGAADVLRNARVADSFEEAIEGVQYLCATVMTPRDFGPPTTTPRAHLAELARSGQSVAFVFGSERYGMRNEDVYRCHFALTIPTAPGYGSLNLAAAIQVIAYEWRSSLDTANSAAAALGGSATEAGDTAAIPPGGMRARPLPAEAADAKALAGMLDHWQQALTDIGFLDPATPRKLMPRLNQLFNRAQPTPEEIHILRGVAKAMSEAARRRKL